MDAQGNAVEAEDYADDRFYCKHGTFIGNPFGGDYLCSWCEDGISDEDFALYVRREANRIMRRHAADTWARSLQGCKYAPGMHTSLIVGIIIAMMQYNR